MRYTRIFLNDKLLERGTPLSYNPLRNEDSLSEYFSSASDFYLASKNLLKNKKDIDSFVIWFDKCYQIDPRLTTIFVKDNFYKFSPQIRAYVNHFIRKYYN